MDIASQKNGDGPCTVPARPPEVQNPESDGAAVNPPTAPHEGVSAVGNGNAPEAAPEAAAAEPTVPHGDTEAGNGRVPPAKPPGGPAAPPPDPFDPERLRMSQDFAAGTGVKKLIVTVPVAKPSKEVFVRTHPDPAYRIITGVIELKDDRETYLVDPSLRAALAGESTFVAKMLVTTVTRQGVLSLWPVRLPGPDGKIDEWNRSAMEAADAARDHWVRVSSNMSLGAYEIHVATGIPVKPEFPDLPMKEVLRIAFKGKYIDTLDHPVLRKLRGEV